MLKRDRGTVLLLFPAAFMIMIILGAIVIDVSLSHVRARELEAVANDALAALDVEALRTDGEIRFDLTRAEQIVREAVANGARPDAVVLAVVVDRNRAGEPQLTVTLQLEVDFVMAAAMPAGLDSTVITRTRTASILG